MLFSVRGCSRTARKSSTTSAATRLTISPRSPTRFWRSWRVPVFDFTLIEEETSSGKLLTMLGYRNEAKQVAESLLVKIRATGCRTLVTTCPSSFDAFKNDYPALGLDLGGIEVLHATQYLEGLLAAGKIAPQKSLDAKITVQDSDCLCRGNEICDPPRRVLQSIPGVQLAEMTWTREFAHSCGENRRRLCAALPRVEQDARQAHACGSGPTRGPVCLPPRARLPSERCLRAGRPASTFATPWNFWPSRFERRVCKGQNDASCPAERSLSPR